MIVIVANRLPVSIQQRGGSLELVPGTGGLASALEAFHDKKTMAWVGWPGPVRSENRAKVVQRLRKEFGCVPVFLPHSISRGYYAGFSNGTLWPLLHSFHTYSSHSSSDWQAYVRANEMFGEQVVRMIKPGDTVWIHDYHLMLLPQYIRARVPDAKIGFFLHTPFPNYETFRVTPSSRAIVSGMLGADLIGFHTYDYALSFLGCVRHLLGLDNRVGRIINGRRGVKVDVFPLGIDFDVQSRLAENPRVKERMAKMRRQTKGMKIIFSISRLDYTKGIPNQIKAVEALLNKHPELKGRFVYLCVVVPSRERVNHYRELKREIDELVGRINSRFGTLGWMPIRYIYKRLDGNELNALYASGDVALVMPLRDGMNLVAKEYIATRTDGLGVLVLSEMAGAAKELLEALIVNPNDEDEIAYALNSALTMPDSEQHRRNMVMRARLKRADVHAWVRKFLESLDDTVESSHQLVTTLMTNGTKDKIRREYDSSKKRLFLIDYDGTLVPFSARPSQAKPSPKVLQALESLASCRNNEVFLISGRKREDLENWFGKAPFSLVAEHGAWLKARGSNRWEAVAKVDQAWKKRIRPVLELFVDRIPGSSIEEKDFSLAWHYRESDIELGPLAAKELIDALTHLMANLDIFVMAGNKVVEVKSTHVNKGLFYNQRLATRPWDFTFAVGDDETDEYLFEVLPKNSVSIKVGLTASAARYALENPSEVVDLIESLSARQPNVAAAKRA